MNKSFLSLLLPFSLLCTTSLYANTTKEAAINSWMKTITNTPHQTRSLHEAAYTGNVEVAKQCIELSLPISQRDELGRAPLHIAAQAEKPEIVKLLLQAGADVEQRDAQGKRAYELTNNPAVLQLCKPYVKKREQEIAVSKALEAGNLNALKEYLAQGGSPNALDSAARYPLLHTAISKGQNKAALMLLEAGAKAELRFDHGKNYLMIASSQSSPEVVKLLLAKGAKPLHQSNNGATALHDAVWSRKNDNVAALLPAYKSVNYSPDGRQNGLPLYLAVHRGNAQAFELILAAGINPNTPPYGAPLLIAAVKKGNHAIIKALIKAGANPKAKGPDGKSALDHAKGPIAELLRAK